MFHYNFSKRKPVFKILAWEDFWGNVLYNSTSCVVRHCTTL